MQEEIWKDVVGYEGLYQVSNKGRVKSAPRQLPLPTGALYKRKERMLTPYVCNNGYYVVLLRAYGKQKLATIHRLVAIAFIPNPHNLPFINHKDENRLNNNVDNLEWCTPLYNANYGTARQKQRESLMKSPKKDNSAIAKYKAVEQITLDGYVMRKFVSVKDAAQTMNLSENTIIHHCKGRVKRNILPYTFRYDAWGNKRYLTNGGNGGKRTKSPNRRNS